MTTSPALPRPEYPRPQWRRDRWHNLNGAWGFAVDDNDTGLGARWHELDAAAMESDDSPFDQQIVVPFAPHTPASGVADTALHRVVWYARTFDADGLAKPGERLLLHIGAADHDTTVWVNGQHVASHRGGYTPISADITGAMIDGDNVLVVRVADDHSDLGQPRGKQYWLEQSEYVFYRGTTGIWQTVWLEPVAVASVLDARVVPVLQDASVDVTMDVTGAAVGSRLRVTISRGDEPLVQDTLLLTDTVVSRRWRLTEHLSARDAKILEFQGVATWHPGKPRLYDLEFEVLDDRGAVQDHVRSYFGMRSVSTHEGQVLLNGRPIFQRLVLDQGFFPESGYTAPSDEAIRADIELAQQLGFNGARKHQKIEDPRYLYWADRLGFLVWEELPSAYRFSSGSVMQLTAMWQEAVVRDRNHPCIVVWVPTNESWGVPSVAFGSDERQRQHLLAMYHLTKALDPTRLVVSNDGWEHALTDLCTIHDYSDPDTVRNRFADREAAVDSRPLHHPIYIDGHSHQGEPIIVSEFGGVAIDEHGTWGFHTVPNGAVLAKRYREFISAVVSSPVVAGFCWTQLTDIEQEANGLLDADRQPKADVEALREATQQPAAREIRTSIPLPEDVTPSEPS
jgi:beta-galactosidase/beta-glucuronidase